MVSCTTFIVPPMFVFFLIVLVIGLTFGIIDKVIQVRHHSKVEQKLKHAEEVCSQVVDLLQSTDIEKESNKNNEEHTKR